MSRTSSDEFKSGRVFNGYDYALQVWVVKGMIPDCGHPPAMQAEGCCNAHKLAGQSIYDQAAAEPQDQDGMRRI